MLTERAEKLGDLYEEYRQAVERVKEMKRKIDDLAFETEENFKYNNEMGKRKHEFFKSTHEMAARIAVIATMNSKMALDIKRIDQRLSDTQKFAYRESVRKNVIVPLQDNRRTLQMMIARNNLIIRAVNKKRDKMKRLPQRPVYWKELRDLRSRVKALVNILPEIRQDIIDESETYRKEFELARKDKKSRRKTAMVEGAGAEMAKLFEGKPPGIRIGQEVIGRGHGVGPGLEKGPRLGGLEKIGKKLFVSVDPDIAELELGNLLRDVIIHEFLHAVHGPQHTAAMMVDWERLRAPFKEKSLKELEQWKKYKREKGVVEWIVQ